MLPTEGETTIRGSMRHALADARELPAGARRIQEQVFWLGPRGPRHASVLRLRTTRPNEEEA